MPQGRKGIKPFRAYINDAVTKKKSPAIYVAGGGKAAGASFSNTLYILPIGFLELRGKAGRHQCSEDLAPGTPPTDSSCFGAP